MSYESLIADLLNPNISKEEILFNPPAWPRQFRLANILQQGQHRLSFNELAGNQAPGTSDMLLLSLAAYYLMESLPSTVINTFIRENDIHTLHKLVLCQVAAEFSGHDNFTQQREKPLRAFAMEIARDIYHALFCEYAEHIYLRQAPLPKQSTALAPTPPPEPLERFCSPMFEALIAADYLLDTVPDIAKHVPFIRTVADIRYLISGHVYLELIRNHDPQHTLEQILVDPYYTPKARLVAAILLFHQDFIMEGCKLGTYEQYEVTGDQ